MTAHCTALNTSTAKRYVFGSLLATCFSATTAAADLFRKMAATSLILAMQLHNLHSGRHIACSRRVCATTVAALVFPAVFLRIFAHIIRKSVALPVFPAIHFGDNSATTDTY
jgi:hypothetical protein